MGGEDHAGDVGQDEEEGSHQPGQYQPPGVLGRAVHQHDTEHVYMNFWGEMIILSAPAQKVDKQQDDADDEKYQHSCGQADHLRVVLRWKLILAVLLKNVRDSSPKLH